MTQVVVQDDTRASITRPTQLTYRSWPVRAVRKLILLGLHVIGLVQESQRLHIPLFDDVFNNGSRPYTWATVCLDEPTLQISSSRLVAHANFHGITYVTSGCPAFLKALKVLDVLLVLVQLRGGQLYDRCSSHLLRGPGHSSSLPGKTAAHLLLTRVS